MCTTNAHHHGVRAPTCRAPWSPVLSAGARRAVPEKLDRRTFWRWQSPRGKCDEHRVLGSGSVGSDAVIKSCRWWVGRTYVVGRCVRAYLNAQVCIGRSLSNRAPHDWRSLVLLSGKICLQRLQPCQFTSEHTHQPPFHTRLIAVRREPPADRVLPRDQQAQEDSAAARVRCGRGEAGCLHRISAQMPSRCVAVFVCVCVRARVCVGGCGWVGGWVWV